MSRLANTASEQVPQAVQPFLQFTTALREHMFAVAPDQTQTFIHAVGLLGPRHMRDIYLAACATLAPPVERRDEFDALFRRVFLGQALQAPASSEEDDELQVLDEADGDMDVLQADDTHEAGEQASHAENLTMRQFSQLDDPQALTWLKRYGARNLPQRRTLRWQSVKRGTRWDLSRSLRDAVKRDGEVLSIAQRKRRTHQRRVLLLIDISGSMKEQTDSYLRFAHTLSGVCKPLEVFTLGTRLTRISRALRHRDQTQALQQASMQVADWDGGTRLGDALQAFLDVPRFAGFARNAMVVVLSDGLERGEHTALTAAVKRLSRLCWHLGWLTPLASGAAVFSPQTQALQSVLPYIDRLDSGASVADLCRYLVTVRNDKVARHRPIQLTQAYRESTSYRQQGRTAGQHGHVTGQWSDTV